MPVEPDPEVRGSRLVALYTDIRAERHTKNRQKNSQPTILMLRCDPSAAAARPTVAQSIMINSMPYILTRPKRSPSTPKVTWPITEPANVAHVNAVHRLLGMPYLDKPSAMSLGAGHWKLLRLVKSSLGPTIRLEIGLGMSLD